MTSPPPNTVVTTTTSEYKMKFRVLRINSCPFLMEFRKCMYLCGKLSSIMCFMNERWSLSFRFIKKHKKLWPFFIVRKVSMIICCTIQYYMLLNTYIISAFKNNLLSILMSFMKYPYFSGSLSSIMWLWMQEEITVIGACFCHWLHHTTGKKQVNTCTMVRYYIMINERVWGIWGVSSIFGTEIRS